MNTFCHLAGFAGFAFLVFWAFCVHASIRERHRLNRMRAEAEQKKGASR